MSKNWAQSGPGVMRTQLAEYVTSLHAAYLNQATHLAPGDRAGLPLLTHRERPLTVVVAAGRELHVIATRDPLPSPSGPEVEIAAQAGELAWQVRFFDASILPSLGTVETTADGRESSLGIRRALGLTHVAYHIAITPGGGLSQHHAQHAGVALAHQHARALRDGQELRAKFPQCQELIEEFVIADHLGLSSAAGLLAAHIANKTGRRLDPDQADSPRRALLALAKGT